MDISACGARSEPARWLEIAGKLLAARDLVGCKRLAERAVDAAPLLSGADELLAVADVLLASHAHSLTSPTSTHMDISAGGARSEPARWLEIAGKLLAARDLVGCKRLAERAVDAAPLLSGADELLAVADVLLASQRLLPSGRPDPVAILQLQPNPDPVDVKRSFRRLANLLASPRNPHPGADAALRSVEEAFANLSDPSKNPSTNPPPDPASGDATAVAGVFWTACPHCCHVHQYQRTLVGRSLRCPSAGCRRPFVATEIPAAPPIVPGTNMYYCAWGFYPMGFPKAAEVSTNWKPFCPMFSQVSSSPLPGTANGNKQNVESNGPRTNVNASPSNAQSAKSAGSGIGAGPPKGRIKKTTARKNVGAGLKKPASIGVESSIKPSLVCSDSWGGNAESVPAVSTRGININEVANATDGSRMVHFGGDEDIGFDLDVDAPEDILGNLEHLPFLREDENSRRLF